MSKLKVKMQHMSSTSDHICHKYKEILQSEFKIHRIVRRWLYISIWLKQEMYNSSLSNLRPIKGVRTLKVERHNFQIFCLKFLAQFYHEKQQSNKLDATKKSEKTFCQALASSLSQN